MQTFSKYLHLKIGDQQWKQYDSILFAVSEDGLVVNYTPSISQSLRESISFFHGLRRQCPNLRVIHTGKFE